MVRKWVTKVYFLGKPIKFEKLGSQKFACKKGFSVNCGHCVNCENTPTACPDHQPPPNPKKKRLVTPQIARHMTAASSDAICTKVPDVTSTTPARPPSRKRKERDFLDVQTPIFTASSPE